MVRGDGPHAAATSKGRTCGRVIRMRATPNINRPALLIRRGVIYDPMTESLLQRVGEYPDEPYADGKHLLNGNLTVGTVSGGCDSPIAQEIRDYVPGCYRGYCSPERYPDNQLLPNKGVQSTWPRDAWWFEAGFVPTENYNPWLCAMCVRDRISRNGDLYTPYWILVYWRVILDERLIQAMNSAKDNDCGASRGGLGGLQMYRRACEVQGPSPDLPIAGYPLNRL